MVSIANLYLEVQRKVAVDSKMRPAGIGIQSISLLTNFVVGYCFAIKAQQFETFELISECFEQSRFCCKVKPKPVPKDFEYV